MAEAKISGTAPKSPASIKHDLRKVLKTSAIDHLLQPVKGKDAAAVIPSVDDVLDMAHEQADSFGTSNGVHGSGLPSVVFPAMTVKTFSEGDYLEAGDVVLMTRLGSFFAFLLSYFDKSNFAHAAMVFQTPRQTAGIDETFLIETSMGGVEIVSLSQFLEPKKVYADTGFPPDFVVGIKRFEPEWASETHRRMTASRMLHFIENDEYNFRLLAALVSPKSTSIYFKLRDSLRGKAPNIGEYLKKGGNYSPRQFICSGFVQYAFVDMVKTAYNRGLIDASELEKALDDVIFCPTATKNSEIEELLACTPNFLSQTPKLKWKYLIHKGHVFRVDSIAEVDRFFRETLPTRITPPDKA